MSARPDEQDPDWPRYPETVLRFRGKDALEIDLRIPVSEPAITALRESGLAGTFAVLTAFDPAGQDLSRTENERRGRELEAELETNGVPFVRVDACSPDGAHCETGVAAELTRQEAVSLAEKFGQVAIFWFDGASFWIVAGLAESDALRLPRAY